MTRVFGFWGISLLVLALGRPLSAQTLTAMKNEQAIRIATASGPVLEYAWRPSPCKPYVAGYWTPGGVQVLRDAPADHKHHHALMFAVGAEGVDFWGETKGCGLQATRDVEEPRIDTVAGMPHAEFRQRLEWKTDGAQPLVSEQRTIRVVLGKNLPTRLLIWQSRLETAPGRATVKLWGRHYFGLGVRFAQSMDSHARMAFPAGTPQATNNGHLLTQARWGACMGPVDGHTITLAMFDHPRNPRHPAQFFTMTQPFAYLAATLGLEHAPLELQAGRPLELCYGVAIWDGAADVAQIEAFYQRWLALTEG
jgi:hypothetical protein